MPLDSYEVPETTTFAESDEIVIICASIILAGMIARGTTSAFTDQLTVATSLADRLVKKVLEG